MKSKRTLVILVIISLLISLSMSITVLAVVTSELYFDEVMQFPNETIIEKKEDEQLKYETNKLVTLEYVTTIPTEIELVEISSVETEVKETEHFVFLSNVEENIETQETEKPEDPLAIIEIEVLEDNTRIFEFKQGIYTVPNISINGDPDVTETGYVEKIVEVPHYFQQSYPYTNYGGHGTISSHGCGIASAAMVYSYLLDRVILPDELAEKYGRYNTPVGSDWALFTKSASDYGLTIEMRTHKWEDVVTALENGRIVIANAHKDTVFTDGGHYIVFYGITPEGKVLVKDPSIYNYGQWNGKILKEGFENGFDQKYVKYGCFPCWIYAPKDLNAIEAMANTEIADNS